MPDSKKIAFLIAPEGTERVELTEPWAAVKDAGLQPTLLSTGEGEAQLFNHLDRAETFPVDGRVQDASLDDYDALVLPGGVANPDHLRLQPDAVKFVGSLNPESRSPRSATRSGRWSKRTLFAVVG